MKECSRVRTMCVDKTIIYKVLSHSISISATTLQNRDTLVFIWFLCVYTYIFIIGTVYMFSLVCCHVSFFSAKITLHRSAFIIIIDKVSLLMSLLALAAVIWQCEIVKRCNPLLQYSQNLAIFWHWPSTAFQ